MREMNFFERRGLMYFLNELGNFGVNSLSDYVCGTSENGMLNLQNVRVIANHPEKYPDLGGYGLTEGNDVVIRYWTEDGEEWIDYWIPRSAFMMFDDWFTKAMEYDVEIGEIKGKTN